MNPTLNWHDARVFVNFMMAAAMETFDDLGHSKEVKDKFYELFNEKIRAEARRIQNGD